MSTIMTERKTRRRRKAGFRTETWTDKRIRVNRNSKGHFVTWHRIRKYTRGKTATRRWTTTTKRVRWSHTARENYPLTFGTKQVAVYSTVHGENRRWQVRGNGFDTYRALLRMVKHPPKKKFQTIDAWKFLHDEDEYLSNAEWDRRPQVDSHR